MYDVKEEKKWAHWFDLMEKKVDVCLKVDHEVLDVANEIGIS